MEDYSIATEELLAGGTVLSMFAGISAFIIGVFAFIFVFYAALFIATRIPYYKMAKNAGMDKAWLVWIPLAEMYILINLSKREFNIFNWIKTYNRTKVFWYFLISCPVMIVIEMILIIIASLLSIIPPISIIIILFEYALVALYTLAITIIGWRTNYDILMTYGMEQHAMWASIVNCFFPLLMTVFAYIIMNKEPDYSI